MPSSNSWTSFSKGLNLSICPLLFAISVGAIGGLFSSPYLLTFQYLKFRIPNSEIRSWKGKFFMDASIVSIQGQALHLLHFSISCNSPILP
jgi:hypothetical protein